MVKSEFISTRDEGKNMDKGNVVTVGSYLRRETKWKTQPLSQQKKRGIQAVCGHWPRYHELRCTWRGVSPRTAKLLGVAKQFLVELSRNL